VDALIENFFNLRTMLDMLPGLIREGIRNTIFLTVAGFSLGLVLGLVFALLRLSTARPLRWLAGTYIELFRGLPLLLTIVFIGTALPIALRFRWPNFFLPGVLALGIVAGAYIAETIRAGIQAVPRGQMEAARSLGMPHRLAMRTIVLPQAFRIIVPPLTNELVLLIKDTSLLAILGTSIGQREILKYSRDVLGRTLDPSALVAAGLAYLALTVPMTRLVAVLERRNRRSR
jgi:polar amino acid transport system permease protein